MQNRSVTAAAATTDTIAACRSFFTEIDVIIQKALHLVWWQLHAVLRKNIAFPGFDVLASSDALPEAASAASADKQN